ncbi:hypothetical protein [Hoeflea prorocentri]|uniref:Uncharacterized protein n=1 Tax=Hoeflea prorocentri TaxID=1922333 RepID=A0A9X3ZIS4_9HYPH|nr:hypothetical protein [Hoeflea prorocentri]MCY6382739.1 hypothetical protein [Hoeflea prorocentri]MDA5400539.1 hypothetical protein [Hoeflea prorocentri]
MSILEMTKQRCPELAGFLEGCCTAPLNFDGDHPIEHSRHNHIHLWALEWWADHHSWIDLEYRLEFVREIFKHWRVRIKGMPPYQDRGYRLYLYEAMAPTISVVAETPFGFPYSGQPTFVAQRREIMELYLDRSWISNFDFEPFEFSGKALLDQIEKSSGSIGKPTANALGIKVGALRTLIEQMGLQSSVNEIRKKYKRRPARFSDEEEYLHKYRIHEQRIEPGFA